jgi:hypothetical protein
MYFVKRIMSFEKNVQLVVWLIWQVQGPEFKPYYGKKKKIMLKARHGAEAWAD